MTIINTLTSILLFLSAWLLPFIFVLGIVGLIWYRRRLGKFAALSAVLLLLLLGAAYLNGDVSWRLFPALMNGYHYSPADEIPDARLVPRRPELIVERQLAALVGQTGSPPLRQEIALVDYAVDAVHIEDWHNRQWLTADLDTTLIFADGSQEKVSLSLPAKGGSYILFPLLGEINRSAYAWYAPESGLGHLLQTPATVTFLRDESPPITLQLVDSVDVASLAGVNPDASLAVVSDISADLTLLLDVDLRREQTKTGNALLLLDGEQPHRLAETWLSARAIFAPDGERLAYIRSRRNRSLQLVVQESNGEEQVISAVDWMTHHWVGNDQIAYSQNGVAYLHNLNNDETRSLVDLPPHDFMGGQKFRVSPDGGRIAYEDFDGRIWIKSLLSGEQQPIGWDLSELGWGPGMAWRNDGQQLLYTTRNITTLPGQQELWLWDAASDESRLIVRDGPGFLGNSEDDLVNLGNACWVNDETILLVAYVPGYKDDVHLLTAQSDGSGIWDVTPDAGLFYPELHCSSRYVAVNTSRTSIDLYQINSN